MIATLTVGIVWCISIAAITGIGAWFSSKTSLADMFWRGAAFTLLGVQIWHLFLPINTLAVFMCLFIGIAGLVVHFRRFKEIRIQPVFALVFTVGMLALANFSLRATTLYDDGLYHLQAVMWHAEYAIVPGLGNLHTRLAYNSSLYVFASLFQGLPGGAAHYTAGVFTLPLFAICIHALLGRPSISRSAALLFTGSLLLPLTIFIQLGFVNGLSNDYIVILIVFVLAIKMLYLLKDYSITHADTLTISLLCGMLVTLKLSAAVIAISIWLLVLYLNLRVLRFNKIVLWGAGILALFIAVWVVRSIILSGYPFFVSTAFALPVEWRIPLAVAREESAIIGAWARAPGVLYTTVTTLETWFVAWFDRFRSDQTILFNLAFLIWAVLLFVLRRRLPGWLILYTLPFLMSGIFWFISAPDIRFGEFVFWCIGLGWFACALSEYRRSALYLKCIIVSFSALYVVGIFLTPVQSTFQPLPQATTRLIERDGVLLREVYGDDRCWEEPIPCTVQMDPNLRLRQFGSLASGFRVVLPD